MISRLRDGESVRSVAKAFDVSIGTLHRRNRHNDTSVSRRGPEPRMTSAGEAKLVEWLKLNESIARCVPLSCFKEQVARIAGDIGDPTFKGGRNFARLFFQRHPELSRRVAEMTERGRLYAMHPVKLKEYFDKLRPLLEGLLATHIWNMDESGFDYTNLQGDSRTKVIASRGAKQVQTGCDGNRDRISFCFFFNAAGDHTVPIFLLSGKRVTAAKRELMAAYPEALYILCDNATQTEETWAQCAKFFVAFVADKYPGGKHLLLLDGHSSRVSLEAIHAFRASGNSIFTLPPHSSHATQPFDVVLAKPIKSAIVRSIASLRLGSVEVPGVSISQKNIMQTIKMAFKEVMAKRLDTATGEVYTLASRGFAKAGIFPFCRDIVEERYAKPAQWFEDEVLAKKAPLAVPAADERVAAVEKHTKAIMEAGNVTELLETNLKAKRVHAVPGCTLLTGDEHIAKSLAAEQVKSDMEAAAVVKRQVREVTTAANKAAKEARAARVAAKKASKAAGAVGGGDGGAGAPAPAARVATTKGTKRKRVDVTQVEEDDHEASRKRAGERRAARGMPRK